MDQNTKESRIGLAMYTVHNSVAENMRSTFEQLAAMGYRGIEFYGEPKFDGNEVHRALQASGLVMTGWHIEWRFLQPEWFSKTVDYLQKLECPLAVVPCLGGKWQIAHTPQQECEETWRRHMEWLNEISIRLARYGVRTGYHNHEHEFELSYGGKPLFDYLFDGLSKEIVIEFDSGNCIEGGDDPLRVLKKYKGRPMILHLKPYSHKKGFDVVLGDREDENDWNAILGQGEFEWRLIESECETLPELENARLCLKGLRRYLPDLL